MWSLDDVELAFLQLEQIHELLLVDRTAVEQELVRGNGEQRLRHLTHTGTVKILHVLRRHEHGGVFLPHTLQRISDILDRHRIAKPDIKLVQRRDGIALDQQLIRHVGQQVQKDRAADVGCDLVQPLYAEHKESGRGQIAVAIEELCIGAPAHGVQTQQHLLEHLLCVELRLCFIKIQVFDLDIVIEFGQDRIIL